MLRSDVIATQILCKTSKILPPNFCQSADFFYQNFKILATYSAVARYHTVLRPRMQLGPDNIFE